MDWLRRNWPDLLIGVALVAVIAGIIATLISGGSFFPIGQGNRNAGGATTPQTSTVTPGASSGGVTTPPGVTPTAPAGTTEPAGGTQPPAGEQVAGTQTAGAEAAGTQSAGTQPATTPTSDPSSPPIAVLPPGGASSTPAGTAQTTTPSTPPAQATQPAAGAAPAATQATGAAPAGTTAGTAAGATAAAGESSYRVAVGAFGNADNAQRLAATFQSAGYPVLLGTQGNLTIVLVGPYETESQARSVADRIKAGDFGVADATVYRYDPDGSGAGAATSTPPAASGTTAPAATSPAATPPAASTTPAASGEGRYLQVGAYGSRESAMPQIERLQQLGFQVTERTEGTLLKLLVGPFSGTALSDAQARLSSAGIENFAR